MSHGDALSVLEPEALLSEDPDLELVNADAHVWSEAHPCECEAICECGDEEAR